MNRLVRFYLLLVCALTATTALYAQNVISTQPLGTASLCPGSSISVPFIRTGTFSTSSTFTVQLSDGGDYRNLETGGLSYNSNTGIYAVVATIPGTQAAGTTYTLRVLSGNPAVVGTPSATRLTIKTKPAPPTVEPIQTDCQRRIAMDLYSYINFKRLPSAEGRLYDRNQSPATTVPYSFQSDQQAVFFQLPKPHYSSDDGFVYPFSEVPYYVSQVLDGCESDKAQTILRTLYRPGSAPRPINSTGAFTGKIEYCQGAQAYPLDVNALQKAPDNYRITYATTVNGVKTYVAPLPTPSTDTPGSTGYELMYSPIDATKGCLPNVTSIGSYTYLNVIVNARPVKPTVSTNAILLCRNQQPSALTATPSVSGASLVWYGTNATGGTGSPSASVPATNTPGTHKYYVAQKVNDCESERADITIVIKESPAPPTVPATVIECARPPGGISSLFVGLSLTATVGGATTKLYNASISEQRGNEYLLVKPGVGTYTYYATQVVDGCESDRVPIKLTVRPLPPVATPLNIYGADGFGGFYGKITYCQNDKAVSLREFGLQPLPENVSITYQKESGDLGFTGNPPVPNTDKIGTAVYTFRTYLDGCPSTLGYATRLIVTVNPRPEKPVAQTRAITVCQGESVGPLSASATVANASLLWYGANRATGSGSTTAPIPATQNPGTYNYYVTQKLNDCESEQVELTVIVNPIPAAPTVQAVATCANEAALTLQATGTNLRWYSAVSGGAGSDITLVVSTSQAGQTTYYVSQALNGCESPRVALAVTVNAIPGVPVVSTAGPAYCQGAGAVALVATGQGLNWYKESAGGTSLGSSVTPETGTPGNTTYYVSQRINGCEGGRSSLTVRVNAAPATPTVTSAYTYCQKTTPATLTATGTALSWYGTDGKRSDTAPTPSTETPGTVSYYVTQTTEGCESQRAEIKVTTNATPDVPVVQAVAVCQGQTAPALQAIGQSLRWYTAELGGTGEAAAPTVNTGQAGQTTFYVSQSQNGCEGPRASLTATVKALPPAPGVTQRTICQFAPAEPVTATGTSLIWYNADNSRFNSTPSVLTDQGATFTYLVTQTIDGCEGPKATLTVNVLTTPVPTVAKTTVEICQGVTAQPLEATGTNLRWTDPSGVTSTTAPVPSAVVATARPDGDVYYVTQTGTNTCESPRVAIRVFVQTVPTLTVSGTTTINLGQETPLKLAFTGVGPYQYRLSTGLLGTATKDTTILVLPERTTTYQVVDVTNKCGVGQAGSLASITVRVPTIQTFAMSSTTLCVGTSLTAAFQTTGDFNTGSVFKLQLAKAGTDTTKAAFTDLLNSTVANGQLTAAIPTTLGAGTYWVRVMATNPKIPINGSISPTLLTIRPLPTAALTGTQSIYEGQSAKLSIAFTGDAPWTFSLQDSSSTGSGVVKSVQTGANPHTIDVSPTQSTTYILRDVQNGCGLTKLTLTPILVTVNKVLGVEDQALADALDVYPVPAVTTLTVRLRGLSPAQTARIELISETGLAAWQTETRQETSVLSLDRQPAGVYVLRVRVGDRLASRRIVKR